MLVQLAIRDFAVVTFAELDFGGGLTVISGETGAGKSLLVDALGFLSGARADSGMVRHGADRAELSAVFDLADAPAAASWLGVQELDDDGQCQLRRTLRADGGSRAWINGRPATLAQLAELAALLVEIHGQHEHQALLSRASQLDLLDAFAGNADARGEVAGASRRWGALLRERDALSARGDSAERSAWLRHQLEELSSESLAPTDVERTFADHRRQAHAADLVAACDGAVGRLGGDGVDDGAPPLARTLRQVRELLARVTEHEPRLGEVDAMLDAAAIQLDEALLALERIRSDLDLDPASLEASEQRMGRLHELGRKHRVQPGELHAVRDALAAELESLAGAGERLRRLESEVAEAAAAWRSAADVLGRSRVRAAQALGAATTALLGELGMGGGQFEVAIEAVAGDRPDPQGAERVEFLVSANPGQPPRPLRKVASGGELSRISLAIEVAALGMDAVPTMVFDEVDSGIGGAVADIVGRKLRALGGNCQVLCVTHLPQVAAQGHAHYRVSKHVPGAGHPGDASRSAVERLGDDAREEELARMLGGVEVGSEARAAARRLLADAAQVEAGRVEAG